MAVLRFVDVSEEEINVMKKNKCYSDKHQTCNKVCRDTFQRLGMKI